MTTEHPKVTAYVPQPILDALDDWKSQNNIDSRSAAIVAILADYLAVAYPVLHPSTVPATLSNSPSTVLAELAKLSERVTALEQQIQSSAALSSALSTVLPSDDEALSAVPGEVLIESTRLGDEVLGSAPSTVPVTPLSQAALAKRLGCSDKAIEKHRKLGNKESFAKWSRDRDPDSIAWTWEGGGGRGQPLRFMPHLATYGVSPFNLVKCTGQEIGVLCTN